MYMYVIKVNNSTKHLKLGYTIVSWPNKSHKVLCQCDFWQKINRMCWLIISITIYHYKSWCPYLYLQGEPSSTDRHTDRSFSQVAQSSLSVLFFLHEDKICMLHVSYCNGQIKALNTYKQVTQDKFTLTIERRESMKKRRERGRENIFISRYIYSTLYNTGQGSTLTF